jgi:predicted amidophosphoribosyltransferase
MKIEPQKFSGPWKAGYSLAQHTISAEFLGYNEQGHPKFDTIRSDVGEQLYRLKYQGDSAAVAKLAALAADFVAGKGFPVDLVVPLPPSRARAIQPVASIAERVAKRLKIGYDAKGLRKVKDTPELKSLTELDDRKKALQGAFAASPSVRGNAVLLFDDLYRSGASMEEAALALLAGGAKSVYALALTRTRRKR